MNPTEIRGRKLNYQITFPDDTNFFFANFHCSQQMEAQSTANWKKILLVGVDFNLLAWNLIFKMS